MDALFSKAHSLAKAFDHDHARQEAEERAAHVARVSDAQAKLLDQVLDGLEDQVLQAARQGKRELELLVFSGGDVFADEFCYLYLVKGARQPEPGVVPLLDTLRARLQPFRVLHDWKLGTVQNRVVLSWG